VLVAGSASGELVGWTRIVVSIAWGIEHTAASCKRPKEMKKSTSLAQWLFEMPFRTASVRLRVATSCAPVAEKNRSRAPCGN